MLQALGLLALHPEFHDTLLKYDLPDTVMSLILPGDELFYTNQTTKYAKYVKHLAARVLVYLGLFAKVSNKVNLFDMLEINPEPIDLDRPQSFENNFIHHMAIGENMIFGMWRLNTAAISIEKLLDDILKEIKNENSEKIQFSFTGKCDNLTYNMSYLTTIVHPLIIVRLLEHRLFTPLLKKTNSRAPANNSVSLLGSMGASVSTGSTDAGKSSLSSSLNQTTHSKLTKMNSRASIFNRNSNNDRTETPSGILKKNSKITKQSGSASPPPSFIAKNQRANRKFSQDQFPNTEYLIKKNRKGSQISLNNPIENDPNSKMEFVVTDINGKSGNSPNHQITSSNSNSNQHSPINSKSTYLKDLSKKILKRVNSNYSSRKSKKSNSNSNSSSHHKNRLNSLVNEISLDPISSISTSNQNREFRG